MSKQNILVTRTGSPFYSCGQKGFPDMMGIWDYLRTRQDYTATYVGHVVGPDRGSMIRWPVKGLNRDLDTEYIEEMWAESLEKCRELNPTHIVVLEGATPTWSWPDNPTAARIFDFGLRYSAPALWLCHKLKIPRVSIITDPKCYPRDSEMTTIWPECRPHSVLSQENCWINKTIQGKPLKIEAVYAKCEYWLMHGRAYPIIQGKNYSAFRGNQMAQFKELRLRKGREESWRKILAAFHGCDLKIAGKGWDGWPKEVFTGWVDGFDGLLKFLGEGIAGPMIPQKVGFSSTKPLMHAVMGNCPLFFDDYDSACRVLPANHTCRSPQRPGSLSTQFLLDTCERVKEACTIDFTMLDRVLIDGEKIGGYHVA